jgi:hypothetical protein
MDWAKKDYESKTGVSPANATLSENADGDYKITLTDENGDVLDVYTVNPATAIGANSADEEVNLPQTGITSKKNLIIFFGGIALTVFGALLLSYSYILKRREKN